MEHCVCARECLLRRANTQRFKLTKNSDCIEQRLHSMFYKQTVQYGNGSSHRCMHACIKDCVLCMLYCQIFKRFLLPLLTLNQCVVVPWNNRVKQIRTLFRHFSAISCSKHWCELVAYERKNFWISVEQLMHFPHTHIHTRTFSLSIVFVLDEVLLWDACYAAP